MDEHTSTLTSPTTADIDLRNAIEEALWSLDSIRVTKPALEITVSGGQAEVSGLVASPMMRQQIEEVLSRLPARIDLMDDAAIGYAAAHALAADSRTAAIPPGYRLTSHNGHIHLKGKLMPEQAQAMQAVLAGVRGVREVSVNRNA